MIENRYYIFSYIKIWPLVTFSHKLEYFVSKPPKLHRGTAIEIVKKGIFEIDSKFNLTCSGWFIFTFYESLKSELQNATNQTSLSFLVQKFWFFKNIMKNKPNFLFFIYFGQNWYKMVTKMSQYKNLRLKVKKS